MIDPGQKERTLALPFRLSSRGSVAEISDPAQIWDQRVRAALLTRSGERFARLAYGSRLAGLVFSGNTINADVIKDEVSRAFSGLLPALTLGEVDVVWDEIINQTNVSITYQLPNQETITTTVGAVFIDGSLPPVEERL
jgi:phage baseplate assembly protein W